MSIDSCQNKKLVIHDHIAGSVVVSEDVAQDGAQRKYIGQLVKTVSLQI